MHTLSLHELSQSLKKRTFSSTELTQHYLNRIEKAKSLNAFISVDPDKALLAASKADALIKKGESKPLTGIPLAHKDIFCTTALPTTCGSKMLAHYVSPYDATVVQRLQDEGAVLMGKTNMDEFAMGSSNENSYFGPVKNPWNLDCVPGGSSGGSAAAVAADLVPFATGSDTGGSVRQPAAFCGISGLKPTYGLISRYGMIAYASSLDQAGPMARSAEDLALVLQAMAGFDRRDSTSVDQALPDYFKALNKPLSSLRIGLPTCFFHEAIDKDIQKAIHTAVDVFKKAGATLIELDLKLQSYWVPCYYVIASAEASSNLSRYDGIRFGYRAEDPENLLDLIIRSRSEGFGVEVKRRILTGTHVLSSGYYDDYYLQAQKVRRLIQNEFQHALSTVDVILGPTTPTVAFKISEPVTDPTQRYLADIFTVGANLAGLPALSIPVGFSQGRPIGMQLIGAHFSEARLLNAAHGFQQSTDWHLARPSLKQGDL